MTEDFGGVTMSDEDSEEDTQLHPYQCRQPTELQVNGVIWFYYEWEESIGVRSY